MLLPTLLLGGSVTIRAISIPVTASWNANPEPDIAGYKLSYGTSSGVYTNIIDVGKVTSYSLPLVAGTTYYFVVQAYNTSGMISPYSAEMPFTVAGASGPVITSVTPGSGAVGTSTTITGTGFGASQSTSTVTFNGATATPTSWSATGIVVPVPSTATSGSVVVTVGGVASNASTFTVTSTSPTISGLSPTSGPVGTAVTITGLNFGATKGTSTVKFNGTTATPTTWSASSIVVPVPSGATAGNVVVTVGGNASNGVPFTPGTASAITLVQHASKDAGTTSSSTLAFPASNTAGNWLAVAIRAGQQGQTFTVTDTRGNTYRQAVRLSETVDSATMALYYAENVGGGSNTVTVADTVSGGTLRFAILEYSGIATSNSLDAAVVDEGTGTAASSGNATTTTNGDLVLGVASFVNGTTVSAGAGFVVQEQVASPAKLAVEDLRQTTAGAIAATATLSPSDGWATGVAAFRPAVGGGPTPPVVTGLSPNNGPVGTSVTISGSNFGATKGTSTVTFNGTEATPTTWSATSIVVPVPSGATTGNVVVTVSGQASAGVIYTVPGPPSLTNAAPSSGPIGTSVTLTGANFGASKGSSTVTFNGTTATPTSWSATSIVVPVPGGATSGNIVVTVNGIATAGLPYTVTVAPTLTSLSPASGAAGTSVTISGANFGASKGSSTVTFNGTTATPTSWSASSIVVPVPSGATTGNVVVTVTSLASNGLPFTVTPTLTSLSPTSGPVGTSVTIAGANFGATKGSSTVTFNGTSATPTSWSASSIAVPVPAGATTGSVVVTVAGLVSNSLPYTVTVAPSVTDVSPSAGPVGTSVTLSGANFGATKGSSTVKFNGTTATPTSWTDTTIVVPVPSGATSGNVIVTVGGLASIGQPYTVTIAPTLTSLSPSSGVVGTSVTINGANFGSTKGASTVTFNGTGATPTSWSSTRIVVPVPAGASTGSVVVTVNGLASNSLPYTVLIPPSVTGLTPSSAQVGVPVTIAGANFGASKGSSTVMFNGTPATPTAWSANSITVPVPGLATSGNVVVTVSGLASNGAAFSVNPPSLTSSPAQVGPGGTITVSWAGIGSPTALDWIAVVPSGQADTSFTSWAYTTGTTSGSISMAMPATPGAYNLRLLANNGYVRLASSSVTVQAGPPTLTTVAPASGLTGTSITISGSNFGATKGSSTVTFNGTNAVPTAWSSTSITVPVPAGATSGNIAVTVGGVTSNGLPFSVIVPPSLTSVSPTNGPIGTVVTITGANFGATKGTSTVTFNGTLATPTSWSPTSIVVPVPAGATTGNVVVTVGGASGNGIVFSVSAAPVTLTASASQVAPGGTLIATWSGISSPTSTDWIAVVPTGSPDTGFLGWVYTTGAASGSVTITMPMTTGTYNLRLLANNGYVRLASSNTISVQSAATPTLTSVSPNSGPVGTVVTIAGANFGASKGTSTVTFNGTTATPTSWSATSIVVPVPAGATTGGVVVTVGGTASNALTYTVSGGVTLTNVAPSSGPVGTAVTITGTNFGATKGSSTVTFNGTAATPTSWSATSIVVPVPGGATTGNVVVTVGGVASNGLLYTVSGTPALTSLSPNSGSVGTIVTINGANFGATKGASTVTFNGTPATPSSWSASTIVVPVPGGATTGNVIVTVGGVAANGLVFTVSAGAVTITGNPAQVMPGGTLTVTWSGIASPTSLDWIAIAGPSDMDSSYASYRYTTGGASGSVSMTAPATAGTYQLRLFANNGYQRLATSSAIVVQSTSLTAGPTTVNAGSTLTATWQGVESPNPADWLILVPSGAPDASMVSWVNTTGTANGSIALAVPASSTAGSYEVRLLASGGFHRLAASNPVTVAAAAPSLSLATTPLVTSAGGTLTMEWRGITAPTPLDWIGVYAVGAADSDFAARLYTSGRANDRSLATLPGSLALGTYELRLFTNDTFTKLATSNSFEVTSGASVSAGPATIAPGARVSVSWRGNAAPTATDWVGLVPVDGADGGSVVWTYTTGAANGSLALSVPASAPLGTYEVRLFAQNGFARLATSNTVKIGPTASVTPSPVAAGANVTVTWAGMLNPTPKDWLGLVPLNAPDASYVARAYLTGRASDTVPFVLPAGLAAGQYEARIFANDGWQVSVVSNVITVTPPTTSISVNAVTTVAGGVLTADWNAIAAPTATDWIGVYAIGAPAANYVTRVNTNGQASGSTTLTLPGALPVGDYELRLFSNNTFTRLATSNQISVVAGPVVRVVQTSVAAGSTVTATWEGIAAPTSTDWVALVKVGGSETGYVSWTYTNGAASGSGSVAVPAGTEPGSYEIRLYRQNTFERLASSNVVSVVP